MMKPSLKDRTAITRGIEEGVLIRNTKKQQPATPTKLPSARRKTSDEITKTVNGFVQEARAAKSATTSDPMKTKQNASVPARPRMSKNEMMQRLMQGQKFPLKLDNVTVSASSKSTASSAATISFGKNVQRVAEKPLIKSRAELGVTSEQLHTAMKQASAKKKSISSAVVPTKKALSAVTAREVEMKPFRRSSARQNDQIGDANQEIISSKMVSAQKTNSEKRATNNYSPDYYMTSSSSEDEEFGGPSRDRGTEKPISPASKAKIWNEMYKSPGPSFPGWKFRPPAQGRRLNQVGAEEFAETFKNLQVEADRTSKKVQIEEPRQNKFSDYMRKIKSGTKTRDADTSPARLEDNINLKKMYSDQLDAMREKALASIKALDAETGGSDGEISLEVVKDGVSRQYRGMSSTDMLKNAVESLQQHRKASFNIQKSDDRNFADRKSGYEFAQGDRLYRNESDRSKLATPRNKAVSGAAGVGERSRPSKDDVRMRKKETHDVSYEGHSQEAPRIKDNNPLQKLKKISETLKMERANALSRRASASIDFSSSESDYEPDGFRREIK
ncbi:hypothetical protein GE061_016531 [Apolygus lucorum]|uniref:Uncharacterized protein n=1 Tax=Apolygus lucorum TaxID=248454 RepID=A0A6A4JG26_APOLU|nr:hypothetical protein GE061_016531 [Apolygus lucorum]